MKFGFRASFNTGNEGQDSVFGILCGSMSFKVPNFRSKLETHQSRSRVVYTFQITLQARNDGKKSWPVDFSKLENQDRSWNTKSFEVDFETLQQCYSQ